MDLARCVLMTNVTFKAILPHHRATMEKSLTRWENIVEGLKLPLPTDLLPEIVA